MDINREKILSISLTSASLLIWVSSLSLVCISTYSERYQLTGIDILFYGWLGPLGGVFAWYANVFFAFAVFRLLVGKKVAFSPLVAMFLSLDTFRYKNYLINEGGASVPVYGYGWGAILWFLSFSVLLFAAGIRLSEDDSSYKGMCVIAIVFTAVFVAVTTHFYFQDRNMANSSEMKKLNGIVFKRVAVCQQADPVVQIPMEKLTEPLEVVVDAKMAKSLFENVRNYILWGVQTVRFDGYDYSCIDTEEGKVLTVVPESGPAAALLTVEETGTLKFHSKRLSAQMIDLHTGRTVFEQQWERELRSETGYYCPEFKFFPKAEEQPRKLIVQSLGLSKDDSLPEKVFYKQPVFQSVESEIVAYGQDGLTLKDKLDQWKRLHPDHHTIYAPPWVVKNHNCPEGIGLALMDSKSSASTGAPLFVDGRGYYLKGRDYRATCDEKNIYLYKGSSFSRKNQYNLNIEKRTLPDLRPVWGRNINIKDLKIKVSDDNLLIESINQNKGTIVINLSHYRTGKTIIIKSEIID